MRGKTLKTIAAWCLYDWGCASYSIIIITFIIATYFTTKIAENQIIGTYQWANATSIAGVIIALTSPLFGAIADHGGNHKSYLFFFTAIAVIGSALLWYAYPSTHFVGFTLTCVVVSTIGYEVALVFYNSFLPTLAPKGYLGRISGIGWGSGYLGGIAALSIALFAFFNDSPSWLDQKTAEQVRICGPFVALWYGFFALPLFVWVPDIPSRSLSIKQAIIAGLQELSSTLKTVPQEKNIFIYLIAHLFYTDGLNTLFAFGGIYAAGTYHLSFEEVLIFGITMNITAGIGAIALGWMDDFFGSKNTIFLSLMLLIAFGIVILFLHDKYIFWIMALCLCIFVGPVQAASRSLMVRLMKSKENISAEMFGLYALSGRITAFLTPWMFGFMTYRFESQRVGMSVVLVFLLIGALLLLPIKSEEA